MIKSEAQISFVLPVIFNAFRIKKFTMCNSSSIYKIVFRCSLLIVFTDVIYCQQSEGQKNLTTIHTDLVTIWADVLNIKEGKLLRGLGADDFVLSEDGKPQHISLIQKSQPLSVILLIEDLFCGRWNAEWEFKRYQETFPSLGSDAEVGLMVWYSDSVIVQPLTKEHKLIRERLEDRNSLLDLLPPKPPSTLNVEGGLPHPGDAIYRAAKYLDENASPGHRKVILVISYPSWICANSVYGSDQISNFLYKSGITVYGLFQDGSNFSKGFEVNPALEPSGKKRKNSKGGSIDEYTKQTGGQYLIGKPTVADDLLLNIFEMIRGSYTISYYPENTNFDGRFRQIKLELSPQRKAKPGKVKITARSGYKAIRPSPGGNTDDINIINQNGKEARK